MTDTDLTDRARRLTAVAREHLWSPFTQMSEFSSEEPVIIAAGEGPYLVDIHGRRYLDGVSSLWCNVHGHCRREIDDAVTAQLGRIAHSTMLGLANVPAIELAGRLAAVAPDGLTRVFYSDNGSTAVEVGLKMAFQYWRQIARPQEGRNRFICITNGYHGDTLGAVGVGGIELFHEIFHPLLVDAIKAPSPYCYRCPLSLERPACGLACAEELGRIMASHAQEVAALVVEPIVQGAGGMIVSPPGYLKRVRELCSSHGILMIADEVAVGFGRTGKMFACEHEDVRPDIMALSKGLSGGYLPLAATLTTEAIYEAFLGSHVEKKTFFHGHTFTGNPLACAAALASLEIFETDRVLEGLPEKADLMREALGPVGRLRHTGDVRQAGTMVGIELVEDKGSRSPYPFEARMGAHVIREARRLGAVLRPLGNVIVIMPPLSIEAGEIRTLVDITAQAIRAATEGESGS